MYDRKVNLTRLSDKTQIQFVLDAANSFRAFHAYSYTPTQAEFRIAAIRGKFDFHEVQTLLQFNSVVSFLFLSKENVKEFEAYVTRHNPLVSLVCAREIPQEAQTEKPQATNDFCPHCGEDWDDCECDDWDDEDEESADEDEELETVQDGVIQPRLGCPLCDDIGANFHRGEWLPCLCLWAEHHS